MAKFSDSVCMYVCMYEYTYIYSYTHTRPHTQTHTHTHTGNTSIESAHMSHERGESNESDVARAGPVGSRDSEASQVPLVAAANRQGNTVCVYIHVYICGIHGMYLVCLYTYLPAIYVYTCMCVCVCV